MNKPLEDILTGAAEQTFESMAFMFRLDPSEPAPQADPAPARQTVRVAFRGPLAGYLEIAVAEQMLPAIAGNMLGLEPDQPATAIQQADALKELGNVICGNILPEVGTPTDVFEVCAPELAEALPDATAPREPAARVSLCLDAGPVELALFLDAAPAPAGAGARVGAVG